MLKFSSNKLPAGGQLPIRIPPGQKAILVENPNGGQGQVEFTLDGNPKLIPYSALFPNTGQEFDFTDTVNDSYVFTNNAIGANPLTVTLNVWD